MVPGPIPIAFRDFVTAAGRNVIEDWVAEIPGTAKLRLTTILQYLAGLRDWRSCDWVAPLSGDGEGLFEIKFTNKNIQYRPLGCWGPEGGQFTLLAGAIERGDRFEPPNVVDTAQARRREFRTKPAQDRRT